MTAVIFDGYGGSDVLRVARVPRPEPGPGEVQVRMAVAGVNPADWKTRQGLNAAYVPRFPAILGWDVAGTVTATGFGVHAFAVGDRVFGMPAFPRLAGAYAEYVTAHVNDLAALPDRVPFRAAGGAPLAALTAWQALFTAGSLKAGQKVLVNAAAGGVGHVAVQLARWAGAEVVGVASAGHHPFVEGLGAARVLDRARDLAAQAGADKVDLVVDTHGGAEAGLAALLRPRGTFVSIVSAQLGHLRERGFRTRTVLVHPEGRQLARIAELLAAGDLTIAVDKGFPLGRAAAAHAHAERGRTRGKVILEMPAAGPAA
ncbi:NADP-dependent oxidoreductase [Nonomuraea sp. NPDC050783]|uniref:NADP-dependent oxidoreductase n=1 Tax=Nonomuraea sp. NPDC050783 TaxID=3154634 RepID=UPI003467665B